MISDEKFVAREHILKTADFGRCYKKGRCYRKSPLILYCLPNDLGNGRIGFSISSKNVKNASGRNRIRRILREVYRLNKKLFKTGFDIVIVVKQDVSKKISYRSAEIDFLKLVKDAGILR